MLVNRGPTLAGIDSLNIDDTENGARLGRTALLGSIIHIVEHLCRLDRLPNSGFRFHAVPGKIRPPFGKHWFRACGCFNFFISLS